MSTNANEKIERVEKEWIRKCDDLEERISVVEEKCKALEESCEMLEKENTGDKDLKKRVCMLEEKYEDLEEKYGTLGSKFKALMATVQKLQLEREIKRR